MKGRRHLAKSTLLGAVILSLAAAPALAQKTPDRDAPTTAPTVQERAAELAKQEQNPFTRFLRVQLEENAQFGFGPNGDVLNILRIQPIIPFNLNERWTLFARPVIPIIHQPGPGSTDGLGDIALQFLLAPDRTGQFLWGVGPAFSFPSATDDRLGTEQWTAGPAAAGVYTSGPWVVGAVVTNLWSFAGNDRRRGVNAMGLRPFINYNLSEGWSLTSAPSIGADWQANRDNRWLVPLGGGVAKVFAIGRHWISASLEAYYHVVAPQIGPDWQLRFQLTFLFPK